MFKEIHLPNFTELSVTDTEGSFVVEPLWPGYGQTVGNALRRVLLSSLPGAAVTSFKVSGVSHEFTTIPGVEEDAVALMLNLKQVRWQSFSDEPTEVTLTVKGPKKVTASDFTLVAGIEVANPEQIIAHLGPKQTFELSVTVERGRGYSATEDRVLTKPEIGRVLIDALFSPVTHVNFEVEHTRVGDVTNFDKLALRIVTDGSLHPRQALEQAAELLVDHFKLFTPSVETVSVTEDLIAPKKKSKAK